MIHHAESEVSATRAVTPSASTTPNAVRQSSPTTKSHTPNKNACARLMRSPSGLAGPDRRRLLASGKRHRPTQHPHDRVCGNQNTGYQRQQGGVATWPIGASALDTPEHAEGAEHHANRELHRVLRDSGQRRARRHTGSDYHEHG